MISVDNFGSLFLAVNGQGEHGFGRWVFQPGMAYGDAEFWWSSNQKKRPRSHEGIDFFCYEDSRGMSHSLGRSLVPAPCGGDVIGLCRDFLGQSLFLLADHSTSPKGVFVLAHIASDARVGQRVRQGGILGRIAFGRGEVPGHLHVSFLQGDWRDLPGELSWPALLDQQKLRFVRPFL